MTSLITIVVLIPVAFFPRTGIDAYAPLATVVIGGLTIGTVLALFVVPGHPHLHGRPGDAGADGWRADCRGRSEESAGMSVRLRYLATIAGSARCRSRLRPDPEPGGAPGAAASRRGPRATLRVLPAPLPTAREILNRRAALALDEEQTKRLETLARAWSSESARLEAELQTVTTEFSRFMSEAQGSRRTSLQEIQTRSATSASSAAMLGEQRRLHGEAAAGLLTEPQRQRFAQLVLDTSGGRDEARAIRPTADGRAGRRTKRRRRLATKDHAAEGAARGSYVWSPSARSWSRPCGPTGRTSAPAPSRRWT